MQAKKMQERKELRGKLNKNLTKSEELVHRRNRGFGVDNRYEGKPLNDRQEDGV